MRCVRIGIVALGALLATMASAQGPLVEPGEWEFTSTTNAALLPEPIVQTEKRCITDADFDPLKLVVRDHGCRITERSLSGRTLEWKMECPNTLGVASFQGEGELTSYGNRLEGRSSMGTRVEDSAIEVETKWKGRLVGACELE